MEMESRGAVPLQGGFCEWGAYDGSAINIVGYEKICEIRRDSKSAPGEAKQSLIDTIESALDIPGGEKDGGARFRSLFKRVDVLR
jgi:hypothetical protein